MADRGSVMPAVAVIAFGGMIVLGLAFDLGRWGSTWREAAFAADAGAEAGAAMIDEAAAYRGELTLDPGLARETAIEAALAARPRPGRVVEVVADSAQVCVTVRQQFAPTILRAVGVASRPVVGSACAAPAQG